MSKFVMFPTAPLSPRNIYGQRQERLGDGAIDGQAVDLGPGRPVRIVFFLNRGFKHPKAREMDAECDDAKHLIRQAEILMVRLTHGIARQVMTQIFKRYLVPSFEKDKCQWK